MAARHIFALFLSLVCIHIAAAKNIEFVKDFETVNDDVWNTIGQGLEAIKAEKHAEIYSWPWGKIPVSCKETAETKNLDPENVEVFDLKFEDVRIQSRNHNHCLLGDCSALSHGEFATITKQVSLWKSWPRECRKWHVYKKSIQLTGIAGCCRWGSET